MSNKPKTRKPVSRNQSSSQTSGTERILRIVALVALVLIFVLSGLQLAQNGLATAGATTTAGAGSPTAITFPTVPAGGTTIQFAKTYIHPSGLFAISQPIGWNLPPSGEETTNSPVAVTQGAGTPGTNQLMRAGVTFIDSETLSVIHAYTEHNSGEQYATIQDLDKAYNADYFKAAWSNFTGGYKETARTTDNNQSVVSFTLSLNGNTYLGRQISTLDHGWIKAIRLVTPDNNLGLMDNLQKTVWPTLQFFASESTASMTWPAIADSVAGYIIRYEPNWLVQTGTPGTPFVVAGPLSGSSITLKTMSEPNKQIGSEADARAWVTAQNASATVQTVQAATINGAAGFNISYQTPDADGNARSAVSTLLNGTNKLISATFISSAAKVDMLGTVGVPPDVATMRNTLLLIPANLLVPTLTPTITPTASVTPTGADTLTAAANATLTAGAPTITATSTTTSGATTISTAAITRNATVNVTIPATSAPTTVATIAATTAPTSAATRIDATAARRPTDTLPTAGVATAAF